MSRLWKLLLYCWGQNDKGKKNIYTCSGPMQFFSNVFGMWLAERMDVDSTGTKAELYIYSWKLWWNSNIIPQASTICEQKKLLASFTIFT